MLRTLASRSLLIALKLGLFSGLFCVPVLSEANASQLPASEIERRSEFNYKMFCRGCHGPSDEGQKAVPHMQGVAGHFLKFQEGREYLVRVPGSANAALDDEQLAQVLNWIINNIAGDSKPKDFKPFSTEEVGKLRQDPLFEAFQYRQDLLKKMIAKNIVTELPPQPLQ